MSPKLSHQEEKLVTHQVWVVSNEAKNDTEHEPKQNIRNKGSSFIEKQKVKICHKATLYSDICGFFKRKELKIIIESYTDLFYSSVVMLRTHSENQTNSQLPTSSLWSILFFFIRITLRFLLANQSIPFHYLLWFFHSSLTHEWMKVTLFHTQERPFLQCML